MKITTKQVYEASQDREIDLIALFWTILYQWKWILVCGVIGLVIGGGIGVYKYKTQPVADTMTTEETQEAIAGIVNDTEALADTIAYKNNAPIMKLSSTACDEYVMVYDINYSGMVSSNTNSGQPNSVLTSMEAYLANGLYLTDDKFGGLESRYVADMISYTVSDSTLVVKTRGIDKKAAMELADAIDKSILKYGQELSSKFTGYSMKQLSCRHTNTRDVSVCESRKRISDEITSITNSLTNEVTALSAEENTAYSQETARIAEKLGKEYGTTSSSEFTTAIETINISTGEAESEESFGNKKVILFALFGMLIGLIMYIIIYGLVLILKGYMLSVDGLVEIYGLRKIGSIYRGQSGHNIINAFRYRRAIDVNSENKRISNTVKTIIELEDIKNVAVVSSAKLEESDRIIIDSWFEPFDGVEFIVIDDFIDSLDCISTFANVDGVLLTEKIGVSKDKTVDKILIEIAGLNIEIVGCLEL